MNNKFIIYNKTTNLENDEIVDYLKSIISLIENSQEGKWYGLDFDNGIQAESMINKKSKTIVIKGTYVESEDKE